MIKLENLTMVYQNGKGIFDLDFTVSEGEAFGYLGPNGAGKTTTIRNLLGFVNPTRGSCSMNGLDCRSQTAQIQMFLGYLPGEIAFFDEMTGKQFLRFMSEMRKTKDISRQNNLVNRFELDVDAKIRKMSKGMKQKLGIVAAFMHDPKILILDEPTSGLDPLMQNVFIDLIVEEKSRGKTILMSSHSFEEIGRTCDRAGIIRAGRLVAVEDIASLRSSFRQTFTVTVESPADIETIRQSGLEIAKVSNHHIDVVLSDQFDDFIGVLSKCKVKGMHIKQQSLEQVFMKYYGEEQ